MRKIRVALICACCSLIFAGCGGKPDSNAIEAEANGRSDHNFTAETTAQSTSPEHSTQASPLIKEVQLTFSLIPFAELEEGTVEPGLKLVKSVLFGEFDGNVTSLDVFVESTDDKSSSQTFFGRWKINGKEYIIRDLSASLVEENGDRCPAICVFQRDLPGQHRYELIGGLALFANGPGRMLFIVRDNVEGRIVTFEDWGMPGFLDLDGDGTDEFMIEFEGLHMNMPDVRIVRADQGTPVISSSMYEAFGSQQGDSVTISRENDPPLICLSNVMNEEEPDRLYRYSQGKLILTDGPSAAKND